MIRKYIIIPSVDFLANKQAFMNHSTSFDDQDVKVNNLGTKYLLEASSLPPNAIFNNYKWYTKDQMQVILQDDEWK